MSNYPMGVTGHEYAISGPQSERDEQRDVVCEHAGDEHLSETGAVFKGTVWGTVVQFDFFTRCFYWECPACGEEHEEEDEPEEPGDY